MRQSAFFCGHSLRSTKDPAIFMQAGLVRLGESAYCSSIILYSHFV